MKYQILKSLSLISLFILPFHLERIDAKENNKQDIKTINILMPAPFVDSTKDLINKFNITNKENIKVTVIRGPMETEAVSDLAISNLILGNTDYDAILMDVTWLPKYASTGWLEPLDKYIDNKRWEDLLPGAKSGNTYNNKIYRWPLVADMGLLYWRNDLMKKPPVTTDQLVDISRKLVKERKVKYGYIWQGKQYEGLSCVFLELVKGFGGNWIDKNGDVQLNNKESVQAVQWMSKLIKNNISPKSVTNFAENESLQVFESGNAAFMRNWPYAWAELQKKKSKVRGKVGITTMVSKKGNKPIATLGSWGFSILKTSKNKKYVFQVIEELTSYNSQIQMFTQYGYTPLSRRIYNDNKLVNKYPILKALNEGMQISYPRPETPIYAQISDVLQRSLSSVLTKNQDPQKAMNEAQLNTIKIIKSVGGI